MLPHYKVFTRLGISSIHGIGVFAIADIDAGTPLFEFDNTEMVWIENNQIENLSPQVKSLYTDFCIKKNNQYGCPSNFNQLTMAWYMNHSENPNVIANEEYNFFSSRDIKDGEELTINYNLFNEQP